MTTLVLTDRQDLDLEFSRGETPSLRVSFTGVTAEVVAGWTISLSVRRSGLLPPIAEWDVLVDGLNVTFTLDDAVTAILPDHAVWDMRIAWEPDTVRLPLGGRLLLRSRVC